MYGTIAIIITIIGVIYFYNSLIAKKNQVDNIYSGIDTVLKKRYDLIPNLVTVVKKYMEHEKTVLEDIVKLRNSAIKPDILEEETIKIDSKMTNALGSIMIAVENYPELKSNTNVVQLQETLTEVESQISGARRAYNQAVTDYNNAIEMIPTNLIAGMLRYQPKELFEIEVSQAANIDMKSIF